MSITDKDATIHLERTVGVRLPADLPSSIGSKRADRDVHAILVGWAADEFYLQTVTQKCSAPFGRSPIRTRFIARQQARKYLSSRAARILI